MSSFQTFSRPCNHVAVSVPDVEAAVTWYTKVFGFQVIGGRILHIKRSEQPKSPIFAIYGESLNEVRMAYMSTGNGVGFEVFEFVDPTFKANDVDFEYNRAGFFHICLTDPHPNTLAETVVTNGGTRIGVTVQVARGNATCMYVKDPWGNVIEILDISFDQMAIMSV
ncbi:hypothetical protein HJFPF1_13373 [Paramyrothecium foliicola]|nr:hypothetical protein HJFPF1_13373 [Paramyrothecium foliicola]